MQQLELFTEKQFGFKYRKRLYNANQNYMYTAIPIEEGYKLVPVSVLLKKNTEILYLSKSEYKQFISDRELTEVIPKEVAERVSV
ncbi:hypothetical protein [Jeotgalicoccus sp. S0W5]|uniref:hypothetical protein n=1 Tax=Jeotgalicoccus sp. S0W5 TaxID=2527874 RepID=UPI00141516DC|nr:hypothetical protein [Jeotgalicoccus sp. S0W5]